MSKTWYEPHPVSPERKVELRAKGYRIVDIAFAPPDWIENGVLESGGDDPAPEAPAKRGRPRKDAQ